MDNRQPAYLQAVVSDYMPTRQLRSSNQLFLLNPPVRTKIARHAFSQAAPAIWNDLPLDSCSAEMNEQLGSATKKHFMNWLLQTDHAAVSAPTIRFLTTYGALTNLYNNNTLLYLHGYELCICQANNYRGYCLMSWAASEFALGNASTSSWTVWFMDQPEKKQSQRESPQNDVMHSFSILVQTAPTLDDSGWPTVIQLAYIQRWTAIYIVNLGLSDACLIFFLHLSDPIWK